MKKLTATAALLLFGAALCLADQWTGWITDQKCATSGRFTGAEHRKCVEGGQPVVFVNDADKKVYAIDAQDKVAAHAGHHVTVKGSVDGDTLKLTSIDMAAAASK